MEDFKLSHRLPRAFRSASAVVVLLLCAGVLTFGGMFYLWQRYQYVRLGFEVEQLRAEKSRLQEQIEPLEVEAAYLARPERIDALARKRLGMSEPRRSQVIVVEEGPPKPGMDATGQPRNQEVHPDGKAPPTAR
jgi:cell division protein FtsL